MRELRRDRHHAHERERQQPPVVDEVEDPVGVEDATVSWSDRLKFQYMRIMTWYHSQSDDVKTLFKVLLVLVALYVAFGGRFGLENVLGGGPKQNLGNYESGNVYDRYHNGAYRYRDHGDETRRASYDDRSSDNYNYEAPRRTSSSGSSFHLPNLFDGSPQSMILLAGIAYLCYRNGINPFHALMMLNMLNGNRRGGGMRRMGMGAMGGMGYGMMANAFGNRGRGFGGQPPRPGMRY